MVQPQNAALTTVAAQVIAMLVLNVADMEILAASGDEAVRPAFLAARTVRKQIDSGATS